MKCKKLFSIKTLKLWPLKSLFMAGVKLLYIIEGNDRKYGVIFSSCQKCQRGATPKLPK